MTTLNKAVSINHPIASINHLLPFEQRQHIESSISQRFNRPLTRMSKAEMDIRML
jgi:hypothetical protein